MKKFPFLILAFATFLAQADMQLSIGAASDPNTRYGGKMEDRHVIDTQEQLFAVFDGHGGQSVAQYCADHIVPTFKECCLMSSKVILNDLQRAHKALNRSFFSIERGLWDNADAFNEYDYGYICNFGGMGCLIGCENGLLPDGERCFCTPPDIHFSDKQYGQSGATALVAKKCNDTLIIGNVGDSRAVLIRDGNIIHTTQDHKPNNASEKKRIEKAGGAIYKQGCWRVNGLAISRSLGDIHLKRDAGQSKGSATPIISANPEMYEWQIKKGDLLIIGTDGLWDVMDANPNDNKQLQKIIEQQKARIDAYSSQEIADYLLAVANKRFGSRDNITVLAIRV